jgi:hypothetical protein
VIAFRKSSSRCKPDIEHLKAKTRRFPSIASSERRPIAGEFREERAATNFNRLSVAARWLHDSQDRAAASSSNPAR